MVDMPGYGRASEREWGDLIMDYLRGANGDVDGGGDGAQVDGGDGRSSLPRSSPRSSSLRRVYLLVDSRRRLRERDQQMVRLLEELRISYRILLTKGDLFPPELLQHHFHHHHQHQIEDWIRRETTCCWPHTLWTSVKPVDGGASGGLSGGASLRGRKPPSVKTLDRLGRPARRRTGGDQGGDGVGIEELREDILGICGLIKTTTRK